MKQLLLFLAIAILPATPSFSQTTFGKNTLSISAGPSFAVGNFAKTDPSNVLAGFGGKGQNVNLSFNYHLNQYVGIVAMIYGERNAVNTKALAEGYSKTFYAGKNGSYNKYRNWEVSKSVWLTGSALIGISGEFKKTQSQKMSIIGKALTGVAYVQSPTIDANSKTDTSYAVIKRNKVNDIGQSFFVSGGVKYAFGKRAAVTLTGDFFTTEVTFKNVSEEFASTDGGLVVPRLYSISNSKLTPNFSAYLGNFKQSVSSININLGFTFLL